MTWDRDEAARLRAEGWTFSALAAKFGCSATFARLELVPGQRERQQAFRRVCPGRGEHPEHRYVAYHQPRTPRRIINRDAISDAAREFAAGRITREELMARISGKW